MAIKVKKDKMVITDFQHYWKSKTDNGHEFTFAHGKEFKDVKTFTIQVEHSDKVRNTDGRWSPVKS
tara:strand:- start:58 stop:255 length:198 start_codon:yes stop_codon:yes gene_type:complete